MNNQLDHINAFKADSIFHMVKYANKKHEEYGKILTESEDIKELDLSKHEIHRSVEYVNGNMLFVHDLKPTHIDIFVDSSIQLLIKNLKEANIIELVYPNIFTWIFDGLSLKAYAIVPSGSSKSNSTITRYGGTANFIKILNQHLNNIRKMHKGKTPDYNFLGKNNTLLTETELCVGSINMFSKLYSIPVGLDEDYKSILVNSKTCNVSPFTLNTLDMKYWAREINPDFISEAKHVKLEHSVEIVEGLTLYPPCMKNLMGQSHKGNLNRFRMARFLLSVHKPHDAKFIFDSALSTSERDHIKHGNCNGQWNFIRNNFKNYNCPSCQEMCMFCDPKCAYGHPLEPIQAEIEKNGKEKDC